MSWRTVVITGRAKLDLHLDHLEVRGEDVCKVHLSELHTLILESTAISMTAALMSELMKRQVKVLFCDEKRNPQGELIPYYGTHDTTAKLRQQLQWSAETKNLLWMHIVKEKLRQQRRVLEYARVTDRAAMLEEYEKQVDLGDVTNREGHAAKVYFDGLFGLDFTRGEDNGINASLNYGYSILLSACNREIAASGYNTVLGVFHDNMFNHFNLGCDLMEPFRPIVDKYVWDKMPKELDKDTRIGLIRLMEQEVQIDGSRQHLTNALRIYCRSVFEALNQQSMDELRFYTPLYETDGASSIKRRLDRLQSEKP